MTAILWYSRNPNPRLGVAVGRYPGAPVALRRAATFDPADEARWRALNPTRLLPIPEEAGVAPLWEADAIACRLSQMTG